MYDGERNDVVRYPADRGWQAAAQNTLELYALNGSEFPEDSAVAFGDIRCVTATR
jgi:hypothetical protein